MGSPKRPNHPSDMIAMEKYVVGFNLSEELDRVLLMLKKRPDWQRGFLNGVGGHIELGETPDGAMQREYFEEVGRVGPVWKPLCSMVGDNNDGSGFMLYAFYGVGKISPSFVTDEPVIVAEVDRVITRKERCLGNVPWMLTLALDLIHNNHPPREVVAKY